MHGRVPAGCQREVDDHVHGDQVGHGVVVGPHGAQDALAGLATYVAKHSLACARARAACSRVSYLRR